jgi:WD40 repeat protein
MNPPKPESKTETRPCQPHLTEDEVICVASGAADFLLHNRALAHARECFECSARIRFFDEIAGDGDGDTPRRRKPLLHIEPSEAVARHSVPELEEAVARTACALLSAVGLEERKPSLALAADAAGRGAADAQPITFAALNFLVSTQPDERTRGRVVEALMNPKTRPWFRACHALVHGETADECSRELHEALSQLPAMQRDMARLHHEVARGLRAHGRSLDTAAAVLTELADRFEQPRGLVADLARELLTPPELLEEIIGKATESDWWHGELRPAVQEQKVAGVLVETCGEHVGDGFVVFLTVELMSRNEADAPALRLYPVPSMALCDRDADFVESEAAAIACVEQALSRLAGGGEAGARPCVAEVRWRLTPYLPGRRASRLIGSSLGLAFAFLLRRLFADPTETIARVKLHGVALVGAITRAGDVRPVGSLLKKIRTREYYHTLVVPIQPLEGSELSVLPDCAATGGKAGRAQAATPPRLATADDSVHVLPVQDVETSAVAIEIDAQTRWGNFDFDPPKRQEHFIGRAELMNKTLDFIRHSAAGYGAVVGGMGTGKSSFMIELIHVLLDEGFHPVFHLVPTQPDAACSADNLARKLYYHLRRVHLLPEPVERAEWPIVRKLGELLNDLGRRNARTGAKDVILVDAADQVDLPSDTKLVPDILPAVLPPGVVCIISSRPDLAWLRDRKMVAEFFGMRAASDGIPLCTRDWDDIGRYLRTQEVFKLPATLLEGVMQKRNGPPPVFFTVAKQLAELQAGKLSAERRNEYLTKPDLWLSPPEELIERQLSIVLNTVNPDGQQHARIWDALGVFAVARAPISEDELRGLKLWTAGFTDLIVRESANFFFPRDPAGPPHRVPFRFEHQGYLKLIRERLRADGREHCHRILAERCFAWRGLRGVARRYALRHAPAHLRRAKMWEELYEILSDFEYLEERMLGNRALPEESGAEAFARRELPEPLAARVVRDLERALSGEPRFPEHHRWYPAIRALHGAFETNASILHAEPGLLVQQLYNELAWEWDGGTDLGVKLQNAVRKPRRMLLVRSHPPDSRAGRVPHFAYREHRGAVNCVALSPDDSVIASASNDTKVILWRAEDGEPPRVLHGHKAPVRAVAWHRDGSLLASLGEDVRIWDPETGECLGVRPGSEGATAIAFSPTDDTLAIAGADGSVRLVSPRGEWPPVVLRERGTRIKCMAYAHNGRLLALGTGDAAGNNGIVELYDAARGIHLRTMPPLRHLVEAIAFAPGDTTIATGSGVHEGKVHFFNVDTGALDRTLTRHSAGIHALAISANGLVVTGSCDLRLGVCDFQTFAEVYSGMDHRDVVQSVAVSRDGRFIVSGGADHAVIVWRVDRLPAGPTPRASVTPTRNIHQGKIHAIRFSHDASLIVTASLDKTARVFTSEGIPTGTVFAMGDHVTVACFSPDGTRVAVGGKATLKIFDLATGAELHSLTGHEDWILDLDWTPDSAYLVSGSQDARAMIWDTRTGAWVRTLHAHTVRVRAVAISPDGATAATSGDDAKIHLWDLKTGQLLRSLHGSEVRIKALAWSAVGLLASAGTDAFIKIWNPLTGEQLATLENPELEVWTLRFSPTGHLAAGCKDGMIRLYDIAAKRQIAAFPCGDAVQAIWFNADGTELRIAERGGANLAPRIHILRVIPPVRN